MDTGDIKVVHEFPRDVREIENTFIPLADGVQLAARIWMPEDALERPVPAILEFLPNRKRDGTSERDALTQLAQGVFCREARLQGCRKLSFVVRGNEPSQRLEKRPPVAEALPAFG